MRGENIDKATRLERLKGIVRRYLRFLARFKVARCYEQTIGITGSIGKSSARSATVTILESRFSVFPSVPDYNGDLGLLCSIFRQEAGFESRKRWRIAMAGATWNLLTDHQRFEKLVLEMAVGRPDGMTDSLRVFRPEITVFTGVAPTHFDEGRFADEDAIFQEKAKLIRTMPHGTAILNRDDRYCRRLGAEDLKADVLWYGHLPASRPVESLPPGLYFEKLASSTDGITAELHLSSPGSFPDLRASSHPLSCPVLGQHHIYVLLPAILTALVTGFVLEQACNLLSTFSLPPGRMTAVPGIESSTILDSSWNASPRSIEAALETLGDYPARRRIALLGSMLQQGDASESIHRGIGRLTPRYADMLITVGYEARQIADGARDQRMPDERIHSFDTAEEAGLYLKESLRRGDVILAKGSRAVRLDHAVRAIMGDPDQADRLLVKR